MKNYFSHTIWLTGMVLALLLALSFLPEGLELQGIPLRKMDILSDLRSREAMPGPDSVAIAFEADTLPPDTGLVPQPDSLLPDSAAIANGDALPAMRPMVDSSQFGYIIEDYTFDRKGLSTFYAAVDSIRAHARTVRVAFYGDSFVEGDILLGDLRDTLQTLWGGAGVGFVPLTSEVAQFKRTLKHQYKGWIPHSIVKKDANTHPFGVNGFVYVPTPEARVHYEGADYFRNTRFWSQVRLFYTAEQPVTFYWQNGVGESRQVRVDGDPGHLKMWKWDLPNQTIRDIGFQFPDTPGLLLYGAALESGPGIYWDNFSLRGNSGGPLLRIQTDMMRQFDRYRHYDLVVVQLGLNAVTNGLTNINWYQAELDRTFKHLRKCFPGKPILIVSVGDRGGKVNGELATMRGVPAIAAMQRNLARKYGYLFYDLYRGMGGPGTMIRFAQQRPRLANLDYTHLTHDGGRVVGRQFADLFLREQNKYRKSTPHF